MVANKKSTPRAPKDENVHPVRVIAKAIRDVHRIAIKSAKLAERLTSYRMPKDEASKFMHDINVIALGIETELKAVPDDWKPAKGTVGSAPIRAGDLVRLRATAHKRFASLLPPDQIYKVSSAEGPWLICATVQTALAGTRMRHFPTANVSIPVMRSGVVKVAP